MKNRFRYVLWAAVVMAAVVFTSCSKDDDDADDTRAEDKGSVEDRNAMEKNGWVGEWSHNAEASFADLNMNGEPFPPQIVEELDFMRILRGDVSLRADGTFVSVMEADTVTGTYGVDGGEFEITYEYLGRPITVKKGANLNEFLAADPSVSLYVGMMDFLVDDFTLGFKDGRLDITLLVESEINADLSAVDDLEAIADLLPQGGISLDGKFVMAFDRRD